MSAEVFELEMLGGGWERRYRKLRPEVEAMPWGTLDVSRVPAEQCLAARKSWTGAAYQEHRTGAACALTLQALIEARAPLDLIAVASRFPLDEMVHVELCARMAMEFGGGTEIIHDPKAMVVGCDASLSPLLQAADLVVRFFCVGEAISIPLLRATWHGAKHPLPKAVLGRIVKDDTMGELAAHPPKTQDDLGRIRGLSAGWRTNDIGARLMVAVEAAKPLEANEMPDREPRRPGLTKDGVLVSDLLKLLLKIRAKETGVAPKLIARSDDLEALAAGVRKDLSILQGWRFDEFGRDALDLVEGRLAFAIENGKLKMSRIVGEPVDA